MDTKAPENIELAYTLKPDLFNEVINDEYGWFFNASFFNSKNAMERYKWLQDKILDAKRKHMDSTITYFEMAFKVDSNGVYLIGLGYFLTNSHMICCYACKDDKYVLFYKQPFYTEEAQARELGVAKYIEIKWNEFVKRHQDKNKLVCNHLIKKK